MPQPITSITTPGYRRRKLAAAILARHSIKPTATNHPNPIRVVCVSDTHNKQPILPPGDILIHAGDLTEDGSFDEVQAGLTWLSSQPHPFKILIAGNHDVLLDETFLQQYPERRYGSTKTKADLNWGDIIYLEDSTITLDIPVHPSPNTSHSQQPPAPPTRKITIFGSPWTPRYGLSAFQYPPSEAESHWSSRLNHHVDLPTTTDQSQNTTDHDLIIVTHGPPKLHLDRRDIHRAGCPFLLSHISRLRPRLHVFGHIHAAHGREDVLLDGVQQTHDQVQIGWDDGWDALVWMVLLVFWAKVKRLVFGGGKERVTTFVNASVVGGRDNQLVNEPIVVEI